jgi:hypothetical protein
MIYYTKRLTVEEFAGFNRERSNEKDSSYNRYYIIVGRHCLFFRQFQVPHQMEGAR